MPAHRVIAALGDLPDVVVENLRTALRAARQHKTVQIHEDIAKALAGTEVLANYRYLDVAVALEQWRQWGLTQLIEGCLPDGEQEVSIAEMAAALTVHRCVAPGSKLAAQRWFPTTALPELLSLPPGKFNNTRVHRVLNALETIEAPLQEKLSQRIQRRRGAFVALFLDATDTWFVGRGPDLAHMRVTKEGILRRRVGIVLLCDNSGLPLRWATVAGNHDEATSYKDMLRTISELEWARDVPVVMDRAMGRGQHLGFLDSLGMLFVTAVPASEFDSWSEPLPLDFTTDVVVAGTQQQLEADLDAVRKAADKAGFEQAYDDRYLLDLGLMDRGEAYIPDEAPSRAAAALHRALLWQADLDSGVIANTSALAEREGLTQTCIRKELLLTGLRSELRRRVFQGDADSIHVSALRDVARLPQQEQSAAFEEAVKKHHGAPKLRPTRSLAEAHLRPPAQVRAVLLFNPDRFLRQRHAAMEQQREIGRLVDELNEGLASPRGRRTAERAKAIVDYRLTRANLLDTFSVETEATGKRGQLVLHRDDQAWAKRRRTDGFTLIVADPTVQGTPAQLVDLYFAKDQVEKDFQTIKSELDLRPVRHRTDPKVCAHVTLCVLALLLERSVEQKLAASGVQMSAAMAFELLATCHLNHIRSGDDALYCITRLSRGQRELLTALDALELADDESVVPRLTPR